MIGEIENIKKGLVVSTVEFDTSKKIIGVSTTNLIPGPTGVAPLEKQGAFQTPQVAETIDFVQAINDTQVPAEEPTGQVELSVLGAPVDNSGLKVPVASDVIVDNPVQVENPSNLTGFDMPNIEAVQEEVKEEVPTEPVAIDIQMPEMPSVVVADEPTGLNESLFEGATPQTETSILEEPTNTQEVVPAVEQPQVNIEMPTIPAAVPVQETQVENFEPVQETQVENAEPVQETQAEAVPVEENVMGDIPTTTISQEIPTFDIQMPTIAETTTPAEEAPQQTETAVQEIAEVQENTQPQELAQEIPTFDIQMPAIAEPTTPEVEAPQQTETAVQEIAEVQENTQPQELVQEEQPVVEEEKVELPETEDVSDLKEEAMNLYKKSMEEIIENFNKAQLEILKNFTDTMNKIREIEVKEINKIKENKEEQKVMENPVVPPVQEQTVVVPQQTQAAPVPGNPLESAAFEIIDAMSAPKM